MAKVEAIVLAAGLSRRMGGPNKLLLPFGDTTVIGAVVRTLLAERLPVTVVTGRDAELVEKEVEGARIVYNERYTEGMGASLAAAASSIQGVDGVMVVLGDMPGLRGKVVRTLVDEFERAPAGAVVAPVYSEEPNRLGHPIIFSMLYRPDLCMLAGDVGARSIIEAHADRVIRVPVEGRLDDVDQGRP